MLIRIKKIFVKALHYQSNISANNFTICLCRISVKESNAVNIIRPKYKFSSFKSTIWLNYCKFASLGFCSISDFNKIHLLICCFFTHTFNKTIFSMLRLTYYNWSKRNFVDICNITKRIFVLYFWIYLLYIIIIYWKFIVRFKYLFNLIS